MSVRVSPFLLQSTMATNGDMSSPEYYPYADPDANSTKPLTGTSSPQPGPSQAPPDYPGVGADVIGSIEVGAPRDGEETDGKGEVSWPGACSGHVVSILVHVCGSGMNALMSLFVAVASVAGNSRLSCTTYCTVARP